MRLFLGCWHRQVWLNNDLAVQYENLWLLLHVFVTCAVKPISTGEYNLSTDNGTGPIHVANVRASDGKIERAAKREAMLTIAHSVSPQKWANLHVYCNNEHCPAN